MTVKTATEPALAGRDTRGVRLVPVVHKFGGAALAGGREFTRVAELLQRQQDHAGTASRCVVVVSAMAGVTDRLARLSAVAPASVTGAAAELQELRECHETAAGGIVCERELAAVLLELHQEFQALSHLVHAAASHPPASRHFESQVLSLGDRLSARILAGYLRASGMTAEFVDARNVVATDANPLNAEPDMQRTRERARRALRPLLRKGIVPIVPGFIGAAPDGSITTLGRGGSDLTAALLGRVLGARDVQLWKDVPGLLTADPRVVPDAQLLPQVTLSEAEALARHGSRLIHPRALGVLEHGVRVRVRPFGDTASEGTVIASGRPDSRQPVKAVTALQKLTMLTVNHAHPATSAATLAFGAIAGMDRPVWFAPLSGGAADSAACMLVSGADASRVVHAIEAAELETPAGRVASGQLQGLRCPGSARVDQASSLSIDVREDVAAIGIVGPGIGGSGVAAARALDALADAGIELLASGMGQGRHSLTLVVRGSDAERAQRAIHTGFHLHLSGGGRLVHARYRSVLLLGAGSIGRQLLTQVATLSGRLRICGVVDSTGYLVSGAGLTQRQLTDIVSLKAAGGSICSLGGARSGSAAGALAELSLCSLPRKVVVDATAAQLGRLHHDAISAGWDLVLANKLPLVGEQDDADELRALLRAKGRVCRFEATVGAGLPVIATAHRLMQSGDTIRKIEGCPSGTLGFVFGGMERGSSFSSAVKLAWENGLTEPDPRADLSGLDVARKALILGRLLGFRGELADVAMEPLVPEALLGAGMDEFVRRLPEMDREWAVRIARERDRGRVLRYRIRVTRRRIAVGVVAVDASESLGRLSGTDNQFTYTTARYRDHPLVIAGPGAGAEVTAAGVLDDLLQLDSAERWP